MHKGTDYTIFWCKVKVVIHWRYRSVWVGFPYTFVVKVPSDWGVTKMSRNGIEPSGLASSTVNWMMYPLCRYVGKSHPCVTSVELQMYHQHISSRSLVGSVQCWWLMAQRPPCKYLQQLDLHVTPWQLLLFVQILIIEKEICVI